MKKILSKILKLIKFYFLITGFLVSVVVFFAIRKSVEKNTPKPMPEVGAVLHLKLSGQIWEKSQNFNLLSSFLRDDSESGVYTEKLAHTLKIAKEDPKIKALLIEIEGVQGSWAQAAEIKNYLEDFSTSKKPIYTWFSRVDSKEYLIASPSTEICVAPMGNLHLTGPVIQLTYFAEALKKLGVEFTPIKVGKYKSAIEPLTLNAPSEAVVSMNNSLESSLRELIIEDISSKRTKSNKKDVQSWFEESFHTASKALALKIVDKTEYFKNYISFLKETHGCDLFEFQEYETHAELKKDSSDKEDSIAIIEAIGAIGAVGGMIGSDGKISENQFSKEVQWALDDEKIKAIILKISSPGGEVTAADNLWSEVKRLNDKKPVVALISSVAASGGYYMIAPTRKIIASPYSITGSIGVFQLIPNFKGLEQWGVHFFAFTQSKRKNILGLNAAPSTEDTNVLQSQANEVYTVFKDKVATGRNLTPLNVEALAQGRVYIAKQNMGTLVDKIGYLPDAIEEAKSLAGIEADKKVALVRWQPEIHSISDCFKNATNMKACFAQQSSVLSNSNSDVKTFLRNLETLSNSIFLL